MNIVVAAGPFTLQNNLLYEPLEDLLKYVIENKPNLLILLGPFLEQNHDCILNGNAVEYFGTHFENLIENIMDRLKEVANLEVVIISSCKDVHHDVVYPTPPYNILMKYPNLKLMPDPCMLNINGIIIGTTSADILFHLGKYEMGYVFLIN